MDEYGTAGVIYDTAALERVKGWVNQQEEAFTIAEKQKKNKEWLIIGSVTIVTSIVALLILKKVVK